MAVVTHDTQYVGLVLVSHSGEIVAGLAGLVGQVAGPDVPIATAGGMPDGSFGTDGGQVLDVLRSAAVGGVAKSVEDAAPVGAERAVGHSACGHDRNVRAGNLGDESRQPSGDLAAVRDKHQADILGVVNHDCHSTMSNSIRQ